MEKYDPKSFEKKWQDRWEESGAFRADSQKGEKGKYYILDMFPYPSAQGLHVGHPVGYIATDIVARKRRMEGYRVMHTMGWDSFGLPAENYAIKVGGHPRELTEGNVENYRRQLKDFGFSYDWSREISTSSPEYYRWTQWIFLQLYKKGLAYRKTAPVNWCETDHTVLANEQVKDGKCERCKNEVVQKELKQWFFRITDYADALLEGLGGINWPENIKTMQRNWIGRSEGAEITFTGDDCEVQVFTTRPDTLFGVTAIVLAPEHPLTAKMTKDECRAEVEHYIAETQKKSELDRTSTDAKDKTGVFTGATVKHPLTDEDVPVWIGDYVLAGYGTGAVMVVPAHDERDFIFAEKYGLKVKWVIAPSEGVRNEESAYTNYGVLENSGDFDGLSSEEAKKKITTALESDKKGLGKVNYHLRDWLISRQRYWGPPIPIIHCDTCGEVPVPEESLPVELPNDVDFRPTGESPLAQSKSFHDVSCPTCGSENARREVDTLDTFVDSSWYFLRYADPKNDKEFASSEAIKEWCPVDMYVGGAEHAVMHLLYARFVTRALKDLGHLSFDEPFLELRNQGLIMGEDGEKMSKSRGNVVNPDEVIEKLGTDTLRLYEMFMGDFEKAKPWSTDSIIGQRRFLEKVVKLSGAERRETDEATKKLLHKTIRKVGDDIEDFKFNTAISAMMIFMNEVGTVSENEYRAFLRILAPFAPHLAEELWEKTGGDGLISLAQWPDFDPTLTVDDEVEMVVQVTGRVKDRIMVSKGASEDEVKELALNSDAVTTALEGKEVVKVIIVPGRLVNIVAK